MIPKEKIEEVRDRASVYEVISDYVPLTKRGQNYLGLCPFHNEKTPSFTVSEAKNMYYCFGCHAGGNAITFLMKHENIEFHDAVKRLARRYGVRIEESKGSQTVSGLNEKLVEINKAALSYFLHSLDTKPEGAVEYLKKRGYVGEILERFRVGYAPSAWDGLSNYLKAKGYDIALAVKAGLLTSKDSRTYDRFRARIMFPITDSSGKVVAFGGRSIDGGEPKYLNSPESPVFKKAATLYAMYQAKKEAQRKGSMLIVEGYFDLIAMHKHGFTNTVATMGTALTSEHLRKLKPFAQTVYAIFDSDEAGRKAALRSLDMAIEEDVPVKVVSLGGAKDPDEFLSLSGDDGMNAAIKEAVPIIDYFLAELKQRNDISEGRGKAAYLNAALPVLAKIKNVAEKGHYVSVVASELGLTSERLYAAMGEFAVKGAGQKTGTPATSPVLMPDKGAKPTRLSEETILKIVISRPNLYGDEVAEAFKNFSDSFYFSVAEAVRSAVEGGAHGASAIVDSIGDESVRSFVAEAAFDDDKGYFTEPEKMLEDAVGKVLNAGRPKPATMLLLKSLEEGGHGDVAESTLRRLSKRES